MPHLLFFRQKPKPILLHCLHCMHSTEIKSAADMPMNCPTCGTEFGSRETTEPTGLITFPAPLTPEAVARIRSAWERAAQAMESIPRPFTFTSSAGPRHVPRPPDDPDWGGCA